MTKVLIDAGVPSLDGFEVLANIKESKIETLTIFIKSLNTI